MRTAKKRATTSTEAVNGAPPKAAAPNPLADIPQVEGEEEAPSRTKIREAVDLTDLSESEGKKLNPEVERTLLKNQEELSKKAVEESKGKNSVETLLVQRKFLFIFTISPKSLIKWSKVFGAKWCGKSLIPGL